MSAIVVTGTDTGIGKTVFAAALAGALGARYWKPVQAGLDEAGDSATVATLSGLPAPRILPEAYRLNTPCSPHRAAELDGVAIDPERLALPTVAGPLVVEGAGGVLVPLTRTLLYADLFARWATPVILVARTELGTINHSLLSIEALRARGVPVLGIAFVGSGNADSEATICAIGGVRRLGRLPILPVLDRETLAAAFAANFAIADFEPKGQPVHRHPDGRQDPLSRRTDQP
ncbi:dethiobiotin synthase [Sphingomonas montana]|uniref:dethiobiotin synthase n=1 Tax=Sphingomonas montana TaxID=1843236 RepID=UPI0009F93676|nr:dethiobiotin synthase [Sphingomonas montana]